MSDYHIPVMLYEVLENLEIKPGGWYVDCNLGGGGHTGEILEKGGKVIGIDLDKEAIEEDDPEPRLREIGRETAQAELTVVVSDLHDT